MKVLASAALLGAAAATFPPHQHILQSPLAQAKPVADAWSKPLHTFSEALKHMTAEAKAIWDEVAMHFPGALDDVAFFSSPKPHVRKPDTAWDYVVKGADVQRYLKCGSCSFLSARTNVYPAASGSRTPKERWRGL